MIDAGANADARPEHLVQFAHMGVVFAEDVLGSATRSPYSIGEEPEKGNQLTLEAHALLAGPISASTGTRRAAVCSRAMRTWSYATGSRATSP